MNARSWSTGSARRARFVASGIAMLVALSACGMGGSDVVAGDAGPGEPVRTGPASVEPTPGAAIPSSDGATSARVENAAERVGIRMRVADWSGIDGAMDITGSGAAEDGGDELPKASKASAIRDLGYEQIPWLKGKKWPPEEQPITITLTRAQWAFVLQELRGWLEVGESMDGPEAEETNALDRALIALLERGLASPASTAPGRKAPGTATRAGTRHAAEAMEHQVWLAPFNAYPVEHEAWLPDQLLGISDGAVVVRTGVAWGNVDLTVRALDSAPPALADSMDGWEIAEEETLRITEPLYAFGPLGLWWARDAFIPAGPGLYRVRVRATGRIPDEGWDETEGRTGERYEVTFWPVENTKPHLRYGDDRLSAADYEPYSETGDDYAEYDDDMYEDES